MLFKETCQWQFVFSSLGMAVVWVFGCPVSWILWWLPTHFGFSQAAGRQWFRVEGEVLAVLMQHQTASCSVGGWVGYFCIWLPASSELLLLLLLLLQVYEGQVVGVYNKAGDLKINVCKAKALTNMRASQSEKKVGS